MATRTHCQRDDCEPSMCRCTCCRCTAGKTPNVLKAAATAAIVIGVSKFVSGSSKRFNNGYSYVWPGSLGESDEGSMSPGSSMSSLRRQSSTSTSSCSSFGSSGSSFGYTLPETPDEGPSSPFSPVFGSKKWKK